MSPLLSQICLLICTFIARGAFIIGLLKSLCLNLKNPLWCALDIDADLLVSPPMKFGTVQ